MVNSNFGFTPLREMWLGDCYPISWYDHLPNEIADPLRQITEWTQEDLQKVQKFLESRNIKVQRPEFDRIENHVDDHGQLSKPPITPRDHYLTLGDTLYSLHSRSMHVKDPWAKTMELYQNQGWKVESPIDQPINYLVPPALVRIGKDLYIDQDTHSHVWGFICEWAVETARDYRVNICKTDGHSDGVFCPVAPGALVTTHYKYDYQKTFPGWDVFQLPPTLHNFNCPKDWWTGDTSIDNNFAFSKHILEKAQDWVGNGRETVYEVNMLVLDEKNVLAMKEYEPLNRWLADKGINVHCFDFRTRSFWDGGWHCLTLDIDRDDGKTDLFPNRGDNGVYWKLD